jgi:hypothetical protein
MVQASKQKNTIDGGAYATPNDFKKSAYTDLRLPSGALCAARRVSVEAFIKGGSVPNALLPMMKGALNGVKPEVPKIEDLSEEMIASSLAMFDIATMEAIMIPEVHPVPSRKEDGKRYNEDGSEWERDPAKLYIDEIDTEDKQFVFQWAIGGVTDVAKFRDGTAKELAALQAGKAVVSPAKRVAKRK